LQRMLTARPRGDAPLRGVRRRGACDYLRHALHEATSPCCPHRT
jgi:hypothetical protein